MYVAFLDYFAEVTGETHDEFLDTVRSFRHQEDLEFVIRARPSAGFSNSTLIASEIRLRAEFGYSTDQVTDLRNRPIPHDDE